MTAIAYYIKNQIKASRISDDSLLKNPVILYPLAIILLGYFLLFGWEKTSRMD